MIGGAGATAEEIARVLASGEASAVEVTRAALADIDSRNAIYNAFPEVTRERALADAAAVDAARAGGNTVGPLAGVPFAVKNLFDIDGLITLAGSKINRDRPPAARDATAIARRKAAGGAQRCAADRGPGDRSALARRSLPAGGCPPGTHRRGSGPDCHRRLSSARRDGL